MRRTRLAVGLLAATLAWSAGSVAIAEEPAKPGLSTQGSLRDALTRLGEGRDVELVLSNGKSYRGKLGTVGSDTVLLTQIAGKDFYDVLIVLDEVAAVELRVRGS
jgi:hypothetical protein